MRIFLICSWILLAFIATASATDNECRDVSHNECRIPNRDLQGFVKTREVCQRLCEIFHKSGKCDFYRYTLDTMFGFNCFIYQNTFTDFHDGCGAISGTRNVEGSCLNAQEGTCKVTQSARCRYENGALLEKLSATDKEMCINLCLVKPDCQRWVFYKEERRCELFSDSHQDCKEVFGPPSITPSFCGSELTTTPQPGTTTTTTSGTTPTAPPGCNSDTEDFFPDEDNCMMYYQCIDGSVTHESCPGCDYFDTETKFCFQPTATTVEDCGSRFYDTNCQETTKDGDCPQEYGYFPIAENCKKYKICDNDNPTLVTCQTKVDENGVNQQLLYNGDQVQCDWTYRVRCGTRPVCDGNDENCQCQDAEPVNPGEVCNGVSGVQIFADPFDCQNKIVCIDGATVANEPCVGNTYYEIATDECVANENVCDVKHRPICVDAGSGKKQCRCLDN